MPSRMILEGKWEEAKGRIKEAWGALTDDDLDKSQGNWQQLIGTIRQKTGEGFDTVEAKLTKALDSLSEMIDDDTESTDRQTADTTKTSVGSGMSR